MYSNGGGLGISARKTPQNNGWRPGSGDDAETFKTGKTFVRCICPKCTAHHNVYMLWTGRGIPRKYCVNCKPLIAGYDEAALYEASISAPGHIKKKGNRLESE
ncbi:hypothetical protein DESC_810150 [Desulfosarcina cetonica]|uniref:hypothetical protein n=1 Tax=Desulfosarcina cetonica TaxID=90730 RepID=UPI0006CF64D0|nr:hypothetical protein [Desulfosarcina cetonica]VTR70579.1 hypothetical protein DESC_810150 [Desulfosarcina cetonica]